MYLGKSLSTVQTKAVDIDCRQVKFFFDLLFVVPCSLVSYINDEARKKEEDTKASQQSTKGVCEVAILEKLWKLKSWCRMRNLPRGHGAWGRRQRRYYKGDRLQYQCYKWKWFNCFFYDCFLKPNRVEEKKNFILKDQSEDSTTLLSCKWQCMQILVHLISGFWSK